MSLAVYNSRRTNFVPSILKAASQTDISPLNISDDACNASHQDNGSSEPQEPVITRIELVDITEKHKGYGEHPVTTLTSSFHTAKEDRGRYADFAMLIRRKVNKDGDAVSTDVEIRSPIIRKALQGILATYAFLNLAAVPIVITKPYAALFHYRDEIRAYASAPERTSEETHHLNVLTEFLYKNIGLAEKQYTQMNIKGMITFDLLWTLFRAEDDVVSQNDYFKQIYRVVHCRGNQKPTRTVKRSFISKSGVGASNAGKFGPAQETLTIPEFSSTRRITQLAFFPVKCLSEEDQKVMYNQLVERGHQGRSLIGPACRQYNGMFLCLCWLPSLTSMKVPYG